jgi:predicted dienelactone hydrolase
VIAMRAIRLARRALRTGMVVGVVVLGLAAQASAHLFGFTTAASPDLASEDMTHAAAGDHAVGVRRLTPEDDAPHDLTVWYPAVASPDEPAMTYSYGLTVLGAGAATALATYRGAARLGAEQASGSHPLVLLSAGFAITPDSYAWLAEHLASHGMVVVAPHHEETLDPRNLWRSAIDRPQVIAETRAYAESELADVADTSRVAVVGHSYGGYTALAAGGARWNAEAFTTGCGRARETEDPITFLCDALEPRLDDVVARVKPATDPVDAVVSMAGDAAMFGEPGLKHLRAPLLVMGGTADQDSPYDWSTGLAYAGAASRRKVEVALEGAEHFVFSGQCERTRRIATLVPMGFCDDPGWERAEAQAVIKHYVTAFLRSELSEAPPVNVLGDGGASPGVAVRMTGLGDDVR